MIEHDYSTLAEEYEREAESLDATEVLAEIERDIDEGRAFAGPGAIQKAIAASKKARAIKTRKVKIGTSIDACVLEQFKAKADAVGIPYQTLLNSIIKRYCDGKLDIIKA